MVHLLCTKKKDATTPQPQGSCGCGDIATGGTPVAMYFHCEFQCTTTELWCIGVRSAAESCRYHKVRCLHLTVNSQWKLFTFTPKRSFGVKTLIPPASQVELSLNWSTPYGWTSIHLRRYRLRCLYTNFLFKKKVGQRKVYASQALRPEMLLTGPALTGWTSIHLSPYGLRCQKKKTTNHHNRRLWW